MSQQKDVTAVTLVCPVCGQIQVIKGGRKLWREATEEEIAARAMSGTARDAHCPEHGGQTADLEAAFEMPDGHGHQLDEEFGSGDDTTPS